MRMSPRQWLLILLTLCGLYTLTQFFRMVQPCNLEKPVVSVVVHGQRVGANTSLVFVGGVPRSGTTLMRVMLDAHPGVRCGEETRVVPRMLSQRNTWAREAMGVSMEVLDRAVTAFLLGVIAGHGEPAPLLCNKDPFSLKSTLYLAKIFPNSKFLLMLRDGRASVHSMISRHVTIGGFDLSSYRDCLEKWSRTTNTMLAQCTQVGRERCMAVKYEQLVLQPRTTLKKVLAFLGQPWHEAVLHHEDTIGQPGGPSLSRMERSTDQVIRPVNLDALSRWVDYIPPDVKRDMEAIAPMLRKLGYDPMANPPNYGHPDPQVFNNTQRVHLGDYRTPVHLKIKSLASFDKDGH
ncbi:protein-tyrosine sulfotransferase 2 [Osmerus mordax]|uniref:protein-tyrosine sulfotransferase 2 n=1 Tax=Osmerus mordax TaxID=8014 RepID=UPI00350E9D9F